MANTPDRKASGWTRLGVSALVVVALASIGAERVAASQPSGDVKAGPRIPATATPPADSSVGGLGLERPAVATQTPTPSPTTTEIPPTQIPEPEPTVDPIKTLEERVRGIANRADLRFSNPEDELAVRDAIVKSALDAPNLDKATGKYRKWTTSDFDPELLGKIAEKYSIPAETLVGVIPSDPLSAFSEAYPGGIPLIRYISGIQEANSCGESSCYVLDPGKNDNHIEISSFYLGQNNWNNSKAATSVALYKEVNTAKIEKELFNLGVNDPLKLGPLSDVLGLFVARSFMIKNNPDEKGAIENITFYILQGGQLLDQ